MGYLCKNDTLFLDLAQKIKKGVATDFEKKKVHAAIQAFFVLPETQKKKIQAFKKRIQAVSVSTDLPVVIADSYNVTIAEDNYDMGWEATFREVPLGENQDFWEIDDVVNGIVFGKIQEGQRLNLDTVTGSSALAYVDYYGAALGWTDKMIRYRKLAKMVEKARMFRTSFWTNKGNNFYSLIAAAADLNVTAYQGVAGNPRVQRDVLTINLCAFTLGNDNKDKGYGDMANAPLIMYANPFDEDRIEAAFRVTTAALTAGQQSGTSITKRPITRIYTYNDNIVSGSPRMVLPGRKFQKAEDMPLTMYQIPKDPLTLNEGSAGWAIYGGAAADTDQARTCTLG